MCFFNALWFLIVGAFANICWDAVKGRNDGCFYCGLNLVPRLPVKLALFKQQDLIYLRELSHIASGFDAFHFVIISMLEH